MSAPEVRCPVCDQPRTDAEHDRVGDRGHELHEREVGRDQTLRGDTRVEVRASEPVKLRDRGVLVDEGLRLANTGQALLEIGVDDGDPLARHAVQASRLLAEDDGRDGERDGHRERAEPELGVDDDQRDADTDEGDDRDERGEQAVLDRAIRTGRRRSSSGS